MLLYGYALNAVPELRAPSRLIPFTLLMLAHGVLHWISPRLEHHPRWVIAYLVLQGALAFALTMLTGEWTIISLYTALIGEAVGLARDRRLAAAATSLYLALAVLSFLLILGRQELLTSVVMLVMASLFSVFFVVLYTRQADARERAQALLEELEVAHRQLAEYATRVEDLTLAAERARMARELHDTLAQGLAGLILQLEAAQAHLEGGRSARTFEIVDQALAQARATLRDARQAIGDLREEASAAPDLATSVRREVNRFTEATGIPCQLDLSLPSALPEEIVEHARRIVAEGLVNVARHAQADHAWLRVAGDDDRLEIAMRDDGRGFDPARAIGQVGHYGLLGIRERVRLVGGAFEVERRAGAGATLRARLPSDLPGRQGVTHMDNPIRVLIADDHMIVRQGVRLILETDEGIELAGEAADGSEAVRLAGELLPDVVLMDLRMPGMDGLTAIDLLRQQHPQMAIVILTTYQEDDLILRGLQAGARGYLLKDTDRQTLIASIRAAARGETLLQAGIVERLLSHTATSAEPAPPGRRESGRSISPGASARCWPPRRVASAAKRSPTAWASPSARSRPT